MNKILKLIPLIFILTLTLAPFAQAEEHVYYQSDTSIANWWGFLFNAENVTFGGVYLTANNEYLTRATWYLKNDSTTESGSIRAVIIHVNYTSGTYKPLDDEQPVAFSNNTYSLAGLIQPTYVTFYFSSNNLLNSSVSDYYGVILERVSNAASNVRVACTETGEQDLFYDGEGDRHFTYNPYGIMVTVYTDLLEAGPTATPPASYDPATTTYVDYLIDQFMDFMIPLLVMLVPAIILGYVLRMGKWGYIIGLAIGSGLGYVFIPNFPVWLIFLVSLGIIGFAYSEVKRGN